MEPVQWIRGVVPLAAAALMGAGVMTRPPVLVAADPPWQPPPCRDSGPPGRGGEATWYRLDGVLDAAGSLSGMRLTAGLVGGATRHLSLPAESFASGPVGAVVLVGSDDGSRSRLSLLDAARGCESAVHDERAVVRSALLTPDASAVVEHRVDRVTRADLGTWRVALRGGRAARIVAPAPADERYGRTFTTELRWAPDGRLAVTSCGEQACRTRLVEPRTGRTVLVGPTGPVVGIDAAGGVIAHERCAGFPCALVRVDADGTVRELAPGAGRAAMAVDRVVYETGTSRLRILDLRSGSGATVDGDGLVPVGDGSLATAGITHAADAVVLAPGGLVDATGSRVLGPLGRTPVAIEEVQR